MLTKINFFFSIYENFKNNKDFKKNLNNVFREVMDDETFQAVRRTSYGHIKPDKVSFYSVFILKIN